MTKYFMRLKDRLRDATVEFCEMQPGVWDTDRRYEVAKLVDNVYEKLDNFKGVQFSLVTVRGFSIYSSNKSDKTLAAISENAEIVIAAGIYLGTFYGEEHSDCVTGKRIMSCYDVYYDKGYASLRLIYRVEISDDDFTAVYCSDLYSFKEFNLYEFVRSFSVQITKTLEQLAPPKKRAYTRKNKEDF